MTKVNPSQLQAWILGGILVLLLTGVAMIFAPFFTALLWSALLYILFQPLHSRVIRRFDLSGGPGPRGIKAWLIKNLCAAVFALGALLIIAVPFTFLGVRFFRQVITLLSRAQELLTSKKDNISGVFDQIALFINSIPFLDQELDASHIREGIVNLLKTSLQGALRFSGSVARSAGSFLLNIVMMLFCLFFFFADGHYLSSLFLKIIPIRKEYLGTLSRKFTEIIRNLFFGYIMVALIQTVIAYIIFAAFRVEGALVFAGLTFFAVFFPIVGGGLVWLPLGVFRVISGDMAGGIAFLAVSAVFISALDNILRPLFLQNRIRLHPLIIFLAIFGGVQVFGFNGLALGPVIVILFLTVLDLFLTEHGLEGKEQI
jgi:predicted PurR-regulated permease PerM